MSGPDVDALEAKARASLPPDMRGRGDCPERAGVCWCRQNAAHSALDSLAALARSAAELEGSLRDIEQAPSNPALMRAIARAALAAARSREQQEGT